jgi:hypothetical protein
MAAPVPVARATPLGKMLGDGFSTKIAFTSDTNVEFWEKTVTPPGLDGGDAVDLTTMHNAAWRTTAPRHLKTLSEFTLTAGYDPVVFTAIALLINKPDTITVHFPNGGSLAFFGFLRVFAPGEAAEGAMPEATLTIMPTNRDPVDGSEAAPVYTAPV